MQNQNVRLAVSFLIGLIVGIGGYKLWADGRSVTNDQVNNDNASSTPMLVMSGSNGLAVGVQAAGDIVTVSQVILQAPSWVAIHDDVNGTPGRILGAKLFDVGTSTGSVKLLRNTEEGKSYIAVIHADDGNYKNFSAATDKPLLDADGKMTTVKFDVGTNIPASTDSVLQIDSTKY